MARPGAPAPADALPFEVREVKAVPTVKGAEVSPIERLLKSALTSSTGIVAARCGTDTYIKQDGSTGTAGKGALMQEDAAFTIAATQDQTLFDPSDGYVVRRLTPLECERLQGFPDDWTRVPYKGKPAEECPDGPRYKACGNSMAVPVMRWIGERMARVDAGENLYEVEKEAWLWGRS